MLVVFGANRVLISKLSGQGMVNLSVNYCALLTTISTTSAKKLWLDFNLISQTWSFIGPHKMLYWIMVEHLSGAKHKFWKWN